MELPRPLSHSSLSMFSECPQKWKFKYVDRIPEKPRHFFSFGSSVHAALEFFYGVKTLPAPTLEEVLEHYKKVWMPQGYKDPGQEAEYFEQGREIIANFYHKHIADYAIPYFVEYNFNFKVDGVPVTGKVDRIDKLPDGTLSVVDYKTGKALAAERVKGDAQLTMYQMACEELLGAKVARLSFYHLPSLKEQAVDRHEPKLVEGLRKKIVGTAEAIGKDKFEPTPNEQTCRWCDYKPICPVFKHQFSPAQQKALLEKAVSPADEELSALVDRYGELLERLDALGREADEVKAAVLKTLSAKGYARAFGKKYEVVKSSTHRWEFADKKKVLDLIKKAGLYERVLAPSQPKVEQLVEDPQLELDLKARLTELGVKAERVELKATPLS